MLAPAVQNDNEVALKSLSQWELARRRFLRHRLAMVGLIVFVSMVAIAAFGPILIPFDTLNFPGAIKPGGDPPSLTHIMGTDRDGRDVFAMVINGARISLIVGVFSTLIAGFCGVIVGTVAGYRGGKIDNILMRIVDVLFAIPFLFVILVAARFFGHGDVNSLVLIFGLLSWPLIARLVRASFLSLREADFVDAARAVGVGSDTHRLPAHPAERPGPGDRGHDPADGRQHRAGVLRVVPQLRHLRDAGQLGQRALQRPDGARASATGGGRSSRAWPSRLTVIAINFIGDGMRDALDPRTRN